MTTAPTFLCGHPRTPENTRKAGFDHNGRQRYRCATCAKDKTPILCPTCGELLGMGHTGGYHSGTCEPTTCTCETPRPDGIGECGGCHRLALSHSWHAGRPTVDERGVA